ncbi:DUF4254 domain-containing protein [Micromonospora sp. SH-82]|uniref:DUF4254 domain-containing protein n=1 Tax=Micromonospora sp. SH-82 TaxID=3132938 RepID=UPI003EB79844
MISRDSSADDHVVAAAKRSIDTLNEVRMTLISDVDSWVEKTVRVSGAAPLHTETIGSVIDRLAIAWVRWRRLVELDARQRSGIRPSLALRQFTELAHAYDVLAVDVHEGRRRVPRWRALKSYRER